METCTFIDLIVYIPSGSVKLPGAQFQDPIPCPKECSMLFFGDNGQGDLMCAERLTGMNGSPGSPSEDGVGGMVSAAFIHQVRTLQDPEEFPS